MQNLAGNNQTFAYFSVKKEKSRKTRPMIKATHKNRTAVQHNPKVMYAPGLPQLWYLALPN